MTKSMQAQAYVTPELALQFVKEINSSYHKRLSEELSEKHLNKPYANSFADGLIELFNIPISVRKTVKFCLFRAAFDIVESFAHTFLKRTSLLTDEEGNNTLRNGEALIDFHKGENCVSGRINSVVCVYFDLVPCDLNDISALTVELQLIINNIQRAVDGKPILRIR
ncbi:hypothetical protein [Bacillus cereus]|uniref:hypothetical protein n=1 Tax=Bacillus cereus TaxID=1396 RepID=UPI00032FD430|nr:hypothetical protein [Bacillus cereus]EOO44390.1 hypothetical protein ICK_06165 [Bacillus cereus BAG1X2-2]